MNLFPTESFDALKVARYQIRLRALEPAQFPAFAGSALRGAFGHALKSSVCVMQHRDCERCLVASRCIYPNVFEPEFPPHLTEWHNERNAPSPYLLDPPVHKHRVTFVVPPSGGISEPESQPPEGGTTNAIERRPPKWEQHRQLDAGEEIAFGLTLLGRAIEHLPFIVLAIHEMTQRGIGAPKFERPSPSETPFAAETKPTPEAAPRRQMPPRPRFALSEVLSLDADGQRRTIYTEASERLESHAAPPPSLRQLVESRLTEIEASGQLRLRFLTPARIKVDGDLQPRADFALLVRNLLRRVSMLTAVHGEAKLALDYAGLIARAADIQTVESKLRWWDLQRYSARQQTKLKMGGFVGAVSYEGATLGEFLPLLVAGEILRIGKGTSFGLGKFQIESMEAR
jgi:hypothetical protein